MILKRKKIAIQWRNFEFKRSYIFKVIDFWIFWIFLDFIEFISFKKNTKKGFFYLHRTPELSWHAGLKRMRLARKATWQSHARSLGGSSERERVAGATQVHADVRVVPRGEWQGWQVKGPRVSGPW